jgi:hypothetical protein
MPARSILRAKPLRHPQLDLFLINQFAAIGSIESLLDSLLNVDVVLDVLQRHLIGKFIKESPDRFFSVFHGAILSFGDHPERSVGGQSSPSSPLAPRERGEGGRRPGEGRSKRERGYFFFAVLASFFGFLVSFFWALLPLAMVSS